METELNKPQFDYDTFEKVLYSEVCRKLKERNDKEDVYACSIDYWPEFTTCISLMVNTYSHLKEAPAKDNADLMYYKCCEEEWGNWDDFEALSKELVRHYDAMEKWTEGDSVEDMLRWDDAHDRHTRRIIDICVRVLQKVKQSPEYALYPKLNLNVHVREFFTAEEEIEIYKKLNDEEAVKEYSIFLFGE